LLALKDIEHRVSIEAEAMGLQREFPQVGPASVKGIEINHYAAELARVSVWIGEIQWMRRNGFGVSDRPILKPLDNIECRDAILQADGAAAMWPDADVVIGNPPFLGGKLMRTVLGDEYVDRLFLAYDDQVPAEADLVTYWVAKAWGLIRSGGLSRAGLVTTNSIRGGANRRVLEPIATDGLIFDAWDDEAWVVEGAAVRVSIVCFTTAGTGKVAHLNGQTVPQINPDLTGTILDLTKAVALSENGNVAFMGDTKGGSFDVPGDLARQWLMLPLNPNGKSNAEVLRPWVNGMDITRRPADKWIIDSSGRVDACSSIRLNILFGNKSTSSANMQKTSRLMKCATVSAVFRSRRRCANFANSAAASSVSACRVLPGLSRSGSENTHFSF
jgi:type II restriction/modification system DNA methylase subunit YeeA